MVGPRPLSDPRPIVYMGTVPSALVGAATAFAVMAAGVLAVRRWWLT